MGQRTGVDGKLLGAKTHLASFTGRATMTPEQINYFRTFGFFLSRKLLSLEEIELLSRAFDLAMEKARGGALKPGQGRRGSKSYPSSTTTPMRFSLS